MLKHPVERAEDRAEHCVDWSNDEPADQTPDDRAGMNQAASKPNQLGQLWLALSGTGRPRPARWGASQIAPNPPTTAKIHHGSALFLRFAVRTGLFGAKDEDGPRRRQRERVECRNDHGRGDRHRELPVKLPREPGDEDARDEDRRQDERDGDDRSGQLVHRLNRGTVH